MICDVEVVKDFPLPDTSHGRSKGIHVSSVIRCIATEMGILKPEYAEELSLVDIRDMSQIGIVAQIRIQIGLAWDDYYLPKIQDVISHPGEMYLDGIYLSHDGESLSHILLHKIRKSVVKIHEVKATYKSTNTLEDMDSQFMWLSQVKAYCKAANTLYADLHVLHICGDYSRPIRPMLVIYHLQFTREEVDMNWLLLTQYVQLRMSKEIS